VHETYHIQMITQALQAEFSGRALRAILQANLGQDSLRGLIGHPEFHFDDSRFAESYAYMERQNQAIHAALSAGRPQPAWQAFGRLLHTAQDFYAHSNYVQLWLSGRSPVPPPEEIEALDAAILESKALVSGRIYFWEVFSLIPGLEPLSRRLLPPDAHAWVNLDKPECGPLFRYALAAATQRTRLEYERLVRSLDDRQRVLFGDRG
jgi:hypothetical protein